MEELDELQIQRTQDAKGCSKFWEVFFALPFEAIPEGKKAVDQLNLLSDMLLIGTIQDLIIE
jgi:hypothetical protein